MVVHHMAWFVCVCMVYIGSHQSVFIRCRVYIYMVVHHMTRFVCVCMVYIGSHQSVFIWCNEMNRALGHLCAHIG